MSPQVEQIPMYMVVGELPPIWYLETQARQVPQRITLMQAARMPMQQVTVQSISA